MPRAPFAALLGARPAVRNARSGALTRAVIWLVAALFAWPAVPPRAYAEEAPSEYEIKAAFIYNFLKFTQWPDRAFKSPGEPIRLCTIGTDPFGPALEPIALKPVARRRVTVVRQVGPHAVAGCHAIFVGDGVSPAGVGLARSLQDRPILTIADQPEFAREGGMIGLDVVDGQVRFAVNPSAVVRAGLSISSQVLHLATIEGPAP